MHSFTDLCKQLNRSRVYLRGLQERFQLPVLDGATYSDAYLAFFRTIVYLRTLDIAEGTLRELWQLELKLLQLLHVDSTGSPTWFFDSCGQSNNRERRLLLSNYDLGVPVPSQTLQLGLNFADTPPELFAGTEMGEDAVRVLNQCIKLYARIRCEIQAELPHLREATAWASKLSK